MRSLENLTAQYQAGMDEETRSYLAGRGIQPPEVEAFRLGKVVDPPPEHESFRGMLVIPYITPGGVVSLRFRQAHDCTEECKHAKYLQEPGSDNHLYNVAALWSRSPYVGITEGELDALVLTAYCGIPAVGVPGVTTWAGSPHWWRLFDGREVWLFPDIDPPNKQGKRPGNQLITDVRKVLDSVRVIKLPEPEPDKKMDVNRAFVLHGAEEIRRRAGLVERAAA